jgi:acetyl-CoA C-acetyltransferase
MNDDRKLKPVAIIGGTRIPFCRSNTVYSQIGNRDMAIKTMGALVEQYGLQNKTLGEVAFGAVIKHSRDWNLAREAVLSSGLAPNTPGLTMQRACGTSLDGAIVVANKIATGQIDAGVAGGADTTSDVPIVFKDRFAHRLLATARARSLGQRLKAWKGFRPSELAPAFPGVSEPRTGKSMGDHCELMAREWDISREDQDQLALESHQKLAQAYEDGFMDDLVVAFRGLERDNNLRADSSLEKLASLKPAFDRRSGNGTLTAGNSTPMTDGASCALLASDEWARANGHDVQAYLTHAKVAAVDFVAGEGLLMAPTAAVSQLLADTGLGLQDFDYYEIHEAFAAQVLCTLKAWESKQFCKQKLGLKKALGSIDRERLNVAGSSLAAGHPFAATGTRIVAKLAKLLAKRGSGRGLISICTAGGMGVAAILERP